MEPATRHEVIRFHDLAQQVRNTRLFSWVTGDARVADDPWLLYLSPTNCCNLRCAVCARNVTMRRDRGLLSLDTLDVVLEKIPKSFKKIYIQKQGEPLINPDILTIVRRLRAAFPDAELAMHTNGLRMTPEVAEALVPLLDFVAFSISGISEATYAACHGRPHLKRALRGLQTFLERRRTVGRWDSNIVIDYVHQQGNRSENPDAVAAFFHENYPGLNSVDFHWTDSFQDTVDEARFDAVDHIPERDLPRCVLPWSAFTVLHDGHTDYCFVEPKENVLWPTLMERDFSDIWNGPEFMAFRRAIISGDFRGLEEKGYGCRRCAWIWSTQAQRPQLPAKGGESLPPDLESFAPATSEDLGVLGLKAFAQGDFPRALGYLEWARGQSPDASLADDLDTWRGIVKQGLSQCWPRPDWVAALSAAGRHPADLRSRYVRFGYGLNLAAKVQEAVIGGKDPQGRRTP